MVSSTAVSSARNAAALSSAAASTPLTPISRYTEDLAREGFVEDRAQRMAIARLEDLYHRLCLVQPPSFWQRAQQKIFPSPQLPEKGLYFWGGVGRGKTYLMDIFYDALPFERKLRTHFHRFMRRVHDELTGLEGQKNPLELVADAIAKDARVICFDEFFVTDITDAMILAGLLEALFNRGVTLVATSNIAPQGLYKDGLQRQRFLPAIDLLLEHTEVVNVDGGVDYRLRALQQAALYYSPLNTQSSTQLNACFNRLVADHQQIKEGQPLEIDNREIQTVKVAEDVVWFEFLAICDGPRSQRDYIEVASEYHAVLVANVPQFDTANDDQARRFIYMVDEFYDRNVKLVISAEQPIASLYSPTGRLSFEFERTQSRLLEMQSEEYLALGHKA